MALVARYLVDTSAAGRIAHPRVRERLAPLITAALVATCGPLDLEALYSARDRADYDRRRADRRAAYEYLPCDDPEWQRALEVQGALAASGRWRDAGMADLLVAAVAERHDVTLLHYDADFDAIAAVTGQRTEWIVPRGSVP